MKHVFHRGLVLLFVGLFVPTGCSEPEPEKTTNEQRTTALDVTLPGEIQALRDRIKVNLEAITRTAKQHRITPQQIRNSLYATNWDDPSADRLASMPAPIRVKMKQVRDDFITHNRLLAAAYDEAEGRLAVEEVKP